MLNNVKQLVNHVILLSLLIHNIGAKTVTPISRCSSMFIFHVLFACLRFSNPQSWNLSFQKESSSKKGRGSDTQPYAYILVWHFTVSKLWHDMFPKSLSSQPALCCRAQQCWRFRSFFNGFTCLVGGLKNSTGHFWTLYRVHIPVVTYMCISTHDSVDFCMYIRLQCH